MTREEQIKARTKELSALLDQVESRKLTVLEAIMAAYKMGNDDATVHGLRPPE